MERDIFGNPLPETTRNANGIIQIKGLQSLTDLSQEEQNAFYERNPELKGDRIKAEERFKLQQFANKYGKDEIDSFNTIDELEAVYNSRATDEAMQLNYSNKDEKGLVNPKKGLGNKYDEVMSDFDEQAKRELIEQGYRGEEAMAKDLQDRRDKTAASLRNLQKINEDEVNSTISKIKKNNEQGFFGVLKNIYWEFPKQILKGMGNPMAQVPVGSGITPYNIADANNSDTVADDIADQVFINKNNLIYKTAEGKNAERKVATLAPEVEQRMKAYASISDDQVKEFFKNAIQPNKALGYPGIPAYASYYGVKGDEDIKSEMQDFSINDMREVLAKIDVYQQAVQDNRISSNIAYTALANEAQNYIADHQGKLKTTGIAIKDIATTTAVTLADKVDGVNRLMIASNNKEHEVFMDPVTGELYNENDTILGADGNQYIIDANSNKRVVNVLQLSSLQLHDMGYTTDDKGNVVKNEGFGSWITNPITRNDISNFNTWDDDLREQYKQLGVSPYKPMFHYDDDGSIIYNASIMTGMSFADATTMFIGNGAVGFLGKMAQIADKGSKMARVLSATTKFANGFNIGANQALSTIGISEAYRRGVVEETLNSNLQKLNDSLSASVLNAVHQRYFDEEGNPTEYSQNAIRILTQQWLEENKDNPQINKFLQEGGSENDLINLIAQNNLEYFLQEAMKKDIEYETEMQKGSDAYASGYQHALDEANEAGWNAFTTESVKYGFVNTLGYRKILFKNPARLGNAVPGSFQTGEIMTSGGIKKLGMKKQMFHTLGDKWKQFGKASASQFWGGAWTNWTDEMQCDGAVQINDDAFDAYLNDAYTGMAVSNTYNTSNAFHSFFKGVGRSMGKQSTWEAFLVGGLGSFSPNVNPTNIGDWLIDRKDPNTGITTKEYVKNMDSFFKQHSLEKLNFFLGSGATMEYYQNRNEYKEAVKAIDQVNKAIEDNEGFDIINKQIALGMALDENSNPDDAKISTFLKSVGAYAVMEELLKKNSYANASSVITESYEMYDKVVNDQLTDQEKQTLLAEYYAKNPSVAQSEESAQKAMEIIKQNALDFQEAKQKYIEMSDRFTKYENETQTTLDPIVKSELVIHGIYRDKFAETAKKIASEINVSDKDYTIEELENLSVYGTVENAETMVETYRISMSEIDREIEKLQSKEKELQKQKENKAKETPENSEAEAKKVMELADLDSQIKNIQLDIEDFEIQKNNVKKRKEVLEKSIKDFKDNPSEDKKIEPISSKTLLQSSPELLYKMFELNSQGLGYSTEQQIELSTVRDAMQKTDLNAVARLKSLVQMRRRVQYFDKVNKKLLENQDVAAESLKMRYGASVESAFNFQPVRKAYEILNTINQYLQVNPDFNLVDSIFQSNVPLQVLKIIKEDLGGIPGHQEELDTTIQLTETKIDILSTMLPMIKNQEDLNTKVEILQNAFESQIIMSKEGIWNAIQNLIDTTDDAQIKSFFTDLLTKLGVLDTAKQSSEQISNAVNSETPSTLETAQQKDEIIANSVTEGAVTLIEEKEGIDLALRKLQSKIEVFKNSPFYTYVNDNGDTVYVRMVKKEDGDYRIMQKIFSPDKTDSANWEVEVKGELIEQKGMEEVIATYTSEKSSVKKSTPDAFLGHSLEEYEKEQIGKIMEKFASEKLSSNEEETPNPGETAPEEAPEEKSDVKIDEKPVTEEKPEEKPVAEDTSKDGITTASTTFTDSEGKNETIEVIQGTEENFEQLAEDDSSVGLVAKGNDTTTLDISNGIQDSATPANDADVTNKVFQNNNPAYAGNYHYQYDYTALSNNGEIKTRQPLLTSEKYKNWYQFMEENDINPQEVIDNELNEIINEVASGDRQNLKVYPMIIGPQKIVKLSGKEPATASSLFGDAKTPFAVIEYEGKVKTIHEKYNKENPTRNVKSFNGKEYLIVGTFGFNNTNKDSFTKSLGGAVASSLIQNKIKAVDKLKDSDPALASQLGMNNYDYFVDLDQYTHFTNDGITPGYLVFNANSTRNIFTLLEDANANPHGLKYENLVWGIQRENDMLLSQKDASIMTLKDPVARKGNVFVGIPSASGVMIPAYIHSKKLNEIPQDSKLWNTIEQALNNFLESPDKQTLEDNFKVLRKYLVLTSKGVNIMAGFDSYNRLHVSVAQSTDRNRNKEFLMTSPTAKTDIMNALLGSSPFINVSMSVLKSEEDARMFAEAGCLDLNITRLGSVGSLTSLFPIKDGKPVITDETSYKPESETPSKEKVYRMLNVGGKEYNYDISTGQWKEVNGNGNIITDPAILTSLSINAAILERKLSPMNVDRTNTSSPFYEFNKNHTFYDMGNGNIAVIDNQHNAQYLLKEEEKQQYFEYDRKSKNAQERAENAKQEVQNIKAEEKVEEIQNKLETPAQTVTDSSVETIENFEVEETPVEPANDKALETIEDNSNIEANKPVDNLGNSDEISNFADQGTLIQNTMWDFENPLAEPLMEAMEIFLGKHGETLDNMTPEKLSKILEENKIPMVNEITESYIEVLKNCK